MIRHKKPLPFPMGIPNDGTFIGDDDKKDGFSQRGTVRYGEEADADDL